MDDKDSDVRFRNFAPAIEFMSWVVVALAPMLRLVNGPAVTGDQFAIQVGLFSVALLVGIGLRLYAVWRRTAMTTKVHGGFCAVYSALAVPRFARRTVIVLLVIHSLLLAYSAYVHSPTLNERGIWSLD